MTARIIVRVSNSKTTRYVFASYVATKDDVVLYSNTTKAVFPSPDKPDDMTPIVVEFKKTATTKPTVAQTPKRVLVRIEAGACSHFLFADLVSSEKDVVMYDVTEKAVRQIANGANNMTKVIAQFRRATPASVNLESLLDAAIPDPVELEPAPEPAKMKKAARNASRKAKPVETASTETAPAVDPESVTA